MFLCFKRFWLHKKSVQVSPHLIYLPHLLIDLIFQISLISDIQEVLLITMHILRFCRGIHAGGSMILLWMSLSAVKSTQLASCQIMTYRCLCFYLSNYLIILCFFYLSCFMLGLAIWCLTPLSTIFQLYRGDEFYWWRKPRENHRPVASHWQTSSHNVASSTPCLSGIRTHKCFLLLFSLLFFAYFYLLLQQIIFL